MSINYQNPRVHQPFLLKSTWTFQIPFRLAIITLLISLLSAANALAQLKAGVSKVDITNREAGLVNDPLYAKALILDDGSKRMVIITLDVVAIEEIGP